MVCLLKFKYRVSVYRMPTTILASDVIMNVGEAKYYVIKLLDSRNAAVKNMQIMIDINGTKLHSHYK